VQQGIFKGTGNRGKWYETRDVHLHRWPTLRATRRRVDAVGNDGRLLIESDKDLRLPTAMNYPLLHDHLQNWPNWLRAAAGISNPAPRNRYLHDAFQAINAARRGYGIAR
jgi:hypothetical protein